MCGHIKRLTDGKHRNRERRHFKTIQEIRNAEAQTGLARELVDADDRKRKADEEGSETAQRRIAKSGRDSHEREHHEREILTRPERQREFDDKRSNEGKRDRRQQTRDEGADGGRGKCWSTTSGPGHLVALERRDDRSAFTRGIEQDRRRRAAVHAAIVDAGEHDQRAGRIELVGDRQEKRHRERRTDTRQDADECAERDANQRVEQVDRLSGDRQPLEKEIKRIHGVPLRRTAARVDPPARTVAGSARK